MAGKNDPVDVAQLAQKDLKQAAFPAAGKEDFRIFFEPSIYARIASHAAERLSMEICGVLVGHWHRDANGPFVLVNESIRCDKAVSNAGDVTFTHEAWNTEIYPQMDKNFTDREIVGWYHTHPKFGIFLSERDCFIQEHYFNGPGHIAYVVDPVNGVEGVFATRQGKPVLWPHFWVGNEVHLSTQGTGRQASSPQPGGESSAAAAPRSEAPPVSSLTTWILAAVCCLLLGYLFGSRLTDWERHAMESGVIARYGLLKCLKPEMREDLDRVDENLQKITLAVAALSSEHVKSLSGDEQQEKKKVWMEVVRALQATNLQVRQINNLYSLTPEEAAEVQRLITAKQAEEENLQPAKDSATKDSGSKGSGSKDPGSKDSGSKDSASKDSASKGSVEPPAVKASGPANSGAPPSKAVDTGKKA